MPVDAVIAGQQGGVEDVMVGKVEQHGSFYRHTKRHAAGIRASIVRSAVSEGTGRYRVAGVMAQEDGHSGSRNGL